MFGSCIYKREKDLFCSVGVAIGCVWFDDEIEFELMIKVLL